MKRIMSLALVLMMLLNVAVPTVNVFAEDGATVVSQEENAQVEDAKDTNEVVTNAQAGEPQTDNGNADQQSGDANADKTEEETAPANTEGSAEATDKTAEEKELTDEEMLAGALLANDPKYTFSDGPVGKDVTEAVTVEKLDVYVQDTTGIYLDGKKTDNTISDWHMVTFKYFWHISAENFTKHNVQPGDIFEIEGPSAEQFKNGNTIFGNEYPLQFGEESLGKFKIIQEGQKTKIIARFNDKINNKGEVTDGYYTIKLASSKSGYIGKVDEEATKNAGVGKIIFIFEKPPVRPIGVGIFTPSQITKNAYDKSLEIKREGNSEKETVSVIQWEVLVNGDQYEKLMETNDFEERKEVWIEDTFQSSDAAFLFDASFTIVPRMHTIIEKNGKKELGEAVTLWNSMDVKKIHEPEDNESFDDFMLRLKGSKDANKPRTIQPLEAAVYPNRRQQGTDTLRVMVYLGDLTKDRDYSDVKTWGSTFTYEYIRGRYQTLLDEKRLRPELLPDNATAEQIKNADEYALRRFENTLRAYTTWERDVLDEHGKKIGTVPANPVAKPILYYGIIFHTTHKNNGLINNSARMTWNEGKSSSNEVIRTKKYVSAEGGAKVTDVVDILIKKNWQGKAGGELKFTVTGDDTKRLEKQGDSFVEVDKEPSKYEVTLPAGQTIATIKNVIQNKEILEGGKKKVVPIQFTVTEEMTGEDSQKYVLVENKQVAGSYVFNITNKNTETVRVVVTKAWIGDKLPENSDGSVLVNIYDSRDTKFEYPVSENQKVTYDAVTKVGTLEVNLPKYHLGDKYDSNVPVEYVVKEVKDEKSTLVDNNTEYHHDMNTQTIGLTNTVNTKIILKKLWLTGEGKVNPTATILIKNGDKEVARMETATDKEMTYFLPEFDNANKPITYTVEEAAIDGYSSHKEESVQEGAKKYTFTNRELHNLQVTKKWNNGNTPVSKAVKLTLYYKNSDNEAFKKEYIDVDTKITAVYTNASGEQPAPLDNTDGKVKFTLPADSVDGVLLIKGLPYHDKSGNTLYYSVREDEVEGFLPCIVCNDNKHQEKTLYNLASKTLTLKKAWAVSSDTQKRDVEFILTNNGSAFDYNIAEVIKKANPSVTVEANKIKVIVPKAAGEVRLTVPAYDLKNQEINYKVEEVQLDGFYAPKYDYSTPNQITVKNISSEIVSVKVKKVWRHPKGTPEKNVTIAVRPAQTPEKAVMLPKAGVDGDAKWEHTFEGLPKFDSKTGEIINYEVVETGKPAGYNVNYSEEGDKKLVINTIEGKVSISVSKKWLGAIKADSVTVGLFQNDVDTNKRAVLRAKAGDTDPKVWTDNVTFVDLAQYDGSGVPYRYTIKEIKIGDVDVVNNETADYKVTVNNYEIINYNKEKIEVPFIKTWVGKPAAQVVFRLKADGNVTGQSVTLTAADVIKATETDEWEGKVSWAGKFTNLPKYSETDGHVIVYTVEEEVVAGYTLEQKGNEFINTNTEKIEVSVEKRWVNSSVESVQIELLADGKKLDGITLKAPWKHTFTDLFKYDQTTGKEIVYTVVEKEVPNFKTTYEGDMKNGLIVVNTYIPPIPPYVPETPGGDGDKPTPPNPPTTTEEIPGEPTPEGEPNKPTPPTPTTPPTPGTPPTEPSIPEEEIPTDPIPQGNTELPKTDGIPAGVLWLLGLGLTGLGLFFKKEK